MQVKPLFDDFESVPLLIPVVIFHFYIAPTLLHLHYCISLYFFSYITDFMAFLKNGIQPIGLSFPLLALCHFIDVYLGWI